MGSGKFLVLQEDITWTNIDLLSIGPWRAKFSEILIKME